MADQTRTSVSATELLAAFPEAHIETKSDGEVVIYTGWMWDRDDERGDRLVPWEPSA